MNKNIKQNSFELLCELATKEEWCDKLYCGTCGHTHFRYGLLEIAHGKSPADDDWIVNNKITDYSELIGKFPKKFSTKDKITIIEICLDVDIVSINPNFLDIVLLHVKSQPIDYEYLKSKGYTMERITRSPSYKARKLYEDLVDKWTNSVKNK